MRRDGVFHAAIIAAMLAVTMVASLVGAGSAARAAERAADDDPPLIAPRPPNDILRIPGLPPVELPPGAKVFGPRGPELGTPSKPSVRGEPPKNPRDAEQAGATRRSPTLSQEAQRAKILDVLFGQLAGAGSPDEGKAIAAAIQRVWMQSGSDTADLLMTRALAAQAAGNTSLALELLDHVVEITPDWSEAWNKRATMRFLADDYDGSMADIDHTLTLEPRHFGSLGGLATILQRSGKDKRALEVLRRLIAIYPQQPDIQKLIDRLTTEVEGRDI